jgi:hypothetical protein
MQPAVLPSGSPSGVAAVAAAVATAAAAAAEGEVLPASEVRRGVCYHKQTADRQ